MKALKNFVSVLLVVILAFTITACGTKNNDNDNLIQGSISSTTEFESADDHNICGDFQSSIFGMAIEGEYLFYRNLLNVSDGIKRIPINGGEYSKYNVETIFVPNQHIKDMASKMGWNNSDFYEIEDITTIECIQVVDNWIYWSSECAIWRYPNLFDADIYDLELIAIIGVPERPTSSNFYVDGEWIYFASNAIKQQFDSKTAEVEHTFYKLNLETKEKIMLAEAPTTNEQLGKLYGKEYYQLMDLKTVTGDGNIYFSDYTKDNILLYDGEKVQETELSAYTYDSTSYNDRYKETELYSSNDGKIVAVIDVTKEKENDSDQDYYFFKDENLSFGEEILADNEDEHYYFTLLSDYGYYYCSYISGTYSGKYAGLYKSTFENSSQRIANDKLKHPAAWAKSAGICGEYLYYYTEEKALCRMNMNGGNWEDVSWMINND